jgi:hypothetical protein
VVGGDVRHVRHDTHHPGALLRILIRGALTAVEAARVLDDVCADDRHEL